MKMNLSCGVLPSRQHLWYAIYIRGRCPRLLIVVPSRHQSAYGVLSVLEKRKGELLDGDVGKERLNESTGMSDFFL